MRKLAAWIAASLLSCALGAGAAPQRAAGITVGDIALTGMAP